MGPINAHVVASSRATKIKCFVCNLSGQVVRECPNRDKSAWVQRNSSGNALQGWESSHSGTR
jgi:hypothetical protein